MQVPPLQRTRPPSHCTWVLSLQTTTRVAPLLRPSLQRDQCNHSRITILVLLRHNKRKSVFFIFHQHHVLASPTAIIVSHAHVAHVQVFLPRFAAIAYAARPAAARECPTFWRWCKRWRCPSHSFDPHRAGDPVFSPHATTIIQFFS